MAVTRTGGLFHPPLAYVVIVERGEYVEPWTMEERVLAAPDLKKKIRAWNYRRRWSTIMSGSGDTTHLTKRLWTSEEALAAFLDELRVAGFKKPMPGSFAWPWVERHAPPPTNPTLRVRLTTGGLRASRPRAWNEAVKRGMRLGSFNVYDLNSAYASAAMRPLPDSRRVTYTKRVTSRQFGMYLVAPSVDWRCPIVPSRLRGERRGHWVTKEELVGYDAHRVEVQLGCEWEDEVDLRWQLDEVLENFSFDTAKKILRSFWGGWQCDRPIGQWIFGNGVARELRPLHSRQFSPVWAAHVLSRVAMRCALDGGPETAHVFTDSVMTPRTLATGTEIGAWKLVQTIENPYVAGAGIWGLSEDHLIKHSGRAAHPTRALDTRGLTDTARFMTVGAERWTVEEIHEREHEGESFSCPQCRALAEMESRFSVSTAGSSSARAPETSPLTDSRFAGTREGAMP